MGKKFSELERTSSLNNGDLFAVAQVDAQAQTGYKSKSTETSAVAQKLLKGIEFSTDLETEDKTIIGSINELNSMVVVDDSVSGSMANFKTRLSLPLENLEVEMKAIQASGTPSPSSPLPITGLSSFKLFHQKKNLINKSSYTFVNNSNIIWGGPVTGYADGSLILPAGTYTMSCSMNCQGIYISSDVATIKNVYNTNKSTFTITETLPVRIQIYISGTSQAVILNNDYQLEFGSAQTAFETYEGSITVINLGNTYYGGRFKQDKEGHRQFEITHGLKLFADISFSRSNNSGTWNNYLFYALISDKKRAKAIKCSNYEPVVESIASLTNEKITAVSTSEYIYIRDDAYSTVEDFKSANANTQLLYELATPFTVSLSDDDPLFTYSGINNIYSDSGDVSVKYILTIKDYIDKNIAAVQALVLNS